MTRVGDPVPVVFDTDIGTNVDDALALALALASPEIRLVAVAVGNGDAALLHTRARIAARLLGLAGRAEIPVLIGHPARLSPSDRYTHLGHEGQGLLDVAHDGVEAAISPIPAAEWLVEHSRSTPLHVVATGPLTSVAVAMQRDPSLAARLRHLTVMGGMMQADYNTACDPQAALVCATSEVRLTWVPIEVTRRTAMTRAARERLRAAATPFCDALCRLIDIWPHVARYHDPLAMAAVFGGEWLAMREQRLHYDIQDRVFRAIPAAPTDEATARTARVAVDVDSAAFEEFFVQRVLDAFGT